jgi:hypothetical protein
MSETEPDKKALPISDCSSCHRLIDPAGSNSNEMVQEADYIISKENPAQKK